MLVQEGNFSLFCVVLFLESLNKEGMSQNQHAKAKNNRFEQQICAYTEVNPEYTQFCTQNTLKSVPIAD